MPIGFEVIPETFVSETIQLDHKTPVTDALAKINKFGAVIVMKDGEYLGIADQRTVAKTGKLKLNDRMALSKFVVKAQPIERDMSIQKVAAMFYQYNTKALPFIEGKKFKGIVRRDTILKAILSLHLLSKYKVEAVMTTPVLTVDADASVAQANNTMLNRNVNRLIVLDGSEIAGIVSSSQIHEAFTKFRKKTGRTYAKINRPQSESDVKVIEIAEKSVRDIDYDAPAENALRDMVQYKISSLLVTRGRKPVGIITVRNLLATTMSAGMVEKPSVLVSGLDEYTSEYGADVTDTLQEVADKIEKFAQLRVDHIEATVKRSKERNYELKARIILTRGSHISASSSGYSLNAALKDLAGKLYQSAKERKEKAVMGRRAESEEYE